MPPTTTTRPGAVAAVDIPDPLRPIPRPPRNLSAPQPRLAPDEAIDGTREEPPPPFTRGGARRPDTQPAAQPQITLSTVVTHRNRLITISAVGLTVEQFCDLLDKRGFAP